MTIGSKLARNVAPVKPKAPPSVKPAAVNPVGAVKLAAWLYATHPALFNQLLKTAKAHQTAAAKVATLKGFGCQGCQGNCAGCSGNVTSLSAYRTRRLSGLGDLASSLSAISSDVSSALDPSTITNAVSSGGTSSGGFWSSLGSDLSSAGSSVLSGIGSVGSYLTSQQGLGALTGLANDYFAAKTANAQTQMQQSVLQAQTQRVAQGYNPAAVGYTTNAYGQTVPVAYGANGMTGITAGNFGSIFGTGSNSILIYGGLGLLGLIVLMKVL